MDPSRSRALVYSMITADDLCWPVTTPSQAGGSLMGDGTESMVDEGKELLCPNLGAPRRCSGRGGAETSYDERLQRLFSEWPPQEVLGVKSGAGHALPPVTRLPWPGSTSVDNEGEPDAAQTPLKSTVQITWRAQAALELAARAAAILVERAPHPTAATTQAPLPAAPKTRADPAHAAHQSLKTGVLASLGCRSRAPTMLPTSRVAARAAPQRLHWRSKKCSCKMVSLRHATCYTTYPVPQARWAVTRATRSHVGRHVRQS